MIKVEQTGLTEPIQISADSIQHVEPLGDGSAAAPPAVRITFANTGTIDLGVLYTKHAVNFDPRNRQARDAAVAWLRRLAASTSTAPLGAPQPNTSGVADTRDAWIRRNARLAAIDELRRWGELRTQGLLTDEEFEARKAALLKEL